MIRRPLLGMLTNSFSSIIGLIIGISVAHTSGTVGLGEYGLTLAFYGLALGVAGAVGASSVLAILPSDELIRRFSSRVSLVGLVGGALVTSAGVILGSGFLMVLGPCLHGMLVYDYARKVKAAIRRGASAALVELLVMSVVLASVVLSFLADLPSEFVFAAWCAASMIAGYGQAYRGRLQLRPRWATGADDSRQSAIFGLENLAGAGTGHVLVAALSSFHGLSLIGALRGAATVLGPANLVTTTAQSLVIPVLARTRQLPVAQQKGRSAALAVSLTALVALLAVPIAFLPQEVGKLLLGSAWDDARPVLHIMMWECLAASASIVAIAGHRVHGLGSRLLWTSLAFIPVRLAATLFGAFFAGAPGAAAGMALSATIGSIAYWVSYVGIINSSVQEKDVQAATSGSGNR